MNYDAWASAYDAIFPLKAQTLRFLCQRFDKGKLCDIACGTGNYALALAEAGFPVEGYDLSKPLIDQAKWKTPKDLPVRFSVLDMREFSYINEFCGLYCIGNSLVHLNDEHEIQAVLTRFKAGLKPGSSLIVQIVNYDRVLDRNVTALPTIENPPYKMTRQYAYKDAKIHFKTELFDGKSTQTNTVSLTPLRHKELTQMLKKIGFTIEAVYGGFDERPFDATKSLACVVHAKL